MTTAPKYFQYQLAFFGFILFLASFQIAEHLNINGYTYWGQIFIGYILGFMFSFALLVILELLRGNGYKLIDNNPIFKLISYVCLLSIIIFGTLGFYSTNYVTLSYDYNTAAGIGSIVCAFGLAPVASYHL